MKKIINHRRYGTERLLSLGAAVACMLLGAYIGHVNTLDALNVKQGDSCVVATAAGTDH